MRPAIAGRWLNGIEVVELDETHLIEVEPPPSTVRAPVTTMAVVEAMTDPDLEAEPITERRPDLVEARARIMNQFPEAPEPRVGAYRRYVSEVRDRSRT